MWHRIPRSAWWWGLALTSITLASFSGVVGQPFSGYDDPIYLLNNPALKRGLTWQGIGWAFTTFFDANYNPIAWLSLMLDTTIFGLDPENAGPQKLMSLGYHIATMWILLLLLIRATGSMWRSLAVAALFALHPLHVEPVALVVARKDILAAMFGFAAMLAYLNYTIRPGIWRYLLVAALMILAVLSKATLVTLPGVLLLMDIWPLRRLTLDSGLWSDEYAGRLKRLVLEKLPLMAISAGGTVLAILARKAVAGAASLDASTLGDRIGNAAVSYVRYLGKMLWPANLYHHYGLTPWAGWQVTGAAVILVMMTSVAIAVYKRSPWVLVGWLFYLGTLVPVIGLVQVSLSSIADRYTYFPLTGIFLAILWSIPDAWVASPRMRWPAGITSLVLVTAMAFATHRQVGVWRDDFTRLSHAQADPDSKTNLFLASNQLLAQGRAQEAILLTAKMVKMYPEFSSGYAPHGRALELLGRLDHAESVYRHAIQFAPKETPCRLLLADLLSRRGRNQEAMAQLDEAIRLEPKNPEVYRKQAGVFARLEQHERAVNTLRQVLELDHDDVNSLVNLGVSLDQLDRPEEAKLPLEKAVSLRPDYAPARENLGAVYVRLGRMDDAVSQYEWLAMHAKQDAVRASAFHRLGLLHGQLGHGAEAIANLRHAAELTRDAEVHNDLGVALAKQGNLPEAAFQFAEALKADPAHAAARNNLTRANRALQDGATTTAPKP